MNTLPQKLSAEFAGTAMLLAVIVGSGYMGASLAPGNAAISLLANSIATGLGLWVLIELLAPISGAHFNPLVSLTAAMERELSWRDAAMYIFVQFCGAIVGVIAAHLMFDLEPLQAGVKARSGTGQWFSEFIATAGLMATIAIARRVRPQLLPALVAAYIACAYWFTASTSFANPAVTLARSMTATFAGIRPQDVIGFVVAQTAGALFAFLILRTSRAASVSAR